MPSQSVLIQFHNIVPNLWKSFDVKVVFVYSLQRTFSLFLSILCCIIYLYVHRYIDTYVNE